jgi:ribosome biogenesis GTPase / thiamine phosphate phosphatase
LNNGVVVKTTGSWHTVRTSQAFIKCRLRGSFRIKDIRNTNPLAVGDQVSIEMISDNEGIINVIHPRRNYIIRKATKLSHETQILAANVDQVMLMITLAYPETPLEFVDRFLVSVEAYQIPCIILINKLDLYDADKLAWLDEVKKMYGFAGYNIIAISVTKGINTLPVFDLMKNKLTLIAGNSGVGKSSLINCLSPGLQLKTGEISNYHSSGKHTTTYPEMVEISEKTYVIDSPGIRGFGLTQLNKNEVSLYFTDVFNLSKNCQFYNCTHIHEPHCAVIEAYMTGVLHESRYRSYFKLFSEGDNKYRTN